MRTVYPIALLLATAVLGAAVACGGREVDTRKAAQSGAAPAAASVSETVGGPLIVFMGDSLTAGYGLAEEEAFPAVLERKLGEDGLRVRVVNAGVSGDTSAGGLRRLDWLLKQNPDVLVVGLGGNDALRGQPVEEIASNLRAIIVKARHAGTKVLLLGMRIPPNYGDDYAGRFAAVYTDVARDTGVPLVPFLLDGVGGHAELNQLDGIHPTAKGHEVVARNVLPHLERLLGH